EAFRFVPRARDRARRRRGSRKTQGILRRVALPAAREVCDARMARAALGARRRGEGPVVQPAGTAGMNIKPLAPRSDFPLLAGDPKLHYLDSAATTQKPQAVLDAISGYYERDNANPHRGAYTLSAAATEAYQTARDSIARFLGAGEDERVIFTRGTP